MLIVVLGGGIDLKGNIPSFVYQRLNYALKLLDNYPQAKIVLSGKYSFLYQNKKPPTTEARTMADYLIHKHIRSDQIILEQWSKDTIGNAYYLKKYVFLPPRETSATIITSAFQLERVQFIFKKIFGSKYKLTFHAVQEKLSKQKEKLVVERQKDLLQQTKKLLTPMKDGDHNFLKRKIYNFKYYRQKRPTWVTNFVALGK